MSTNIQTPSVMAYMQEDHRRLDLLLEMCHAAVDSGEMKRAALSFSEFRRGLTRHIKIEEGLLFSEFETATGLDRVHGPTGVMRQEHAEIVGLLGLIQDMFDEPSLDRDGFQRLRSALLAVLKEHNIKEERVIYPMTDSQLPPDRLADLVRRMRSF